MTTLNSIIKRIVDEKFFDNPPGIFSICSSNKIVLEACMHFCKKVEIPILIEATCNQVNQYGGYTGLKPKDFALLIRNLAIEIGFNINNVFIGGDHLGPSVWTSETPEIALQKSKEMIRQYVYANFKKFHLDASMPCLGDPVPIPHEIVAEREAILCKAIFDACDSAGKDIDEMVFVIGTEVPTPGGSSIESPELKISSVQDTKNSIELSKAAFYSQHIERAWEKTLAFVVQPGVEFGDSTIHQYDKNNASDLSHMIEDYPNLVFEAHSTDFQLRKNLKQMVNDHFAILKVGPALTFSFREAVFALEMIEQILLNKKESTFSNFQTILDKVMLTNPQHWEKHFASEPTRSFFQRKFSFLDRSRYYWADSRVDSAFQLLIKNLHSNPIPLGLLSQFMPYQFDQVLSGEIENSPLELIYSHIERVIENYFFACYQNQ